MYMYLYIIQRSPFRVTLTTKSHLYKNWKDKAVSHHFKSQLSMRRKGKRSSKQLPRSSLAEKQVHEQSSCPVSFLTTCLWGTSSVSSKWAGLLEMQTLVLTLLQGVLSFLSARTFCRQLSISRGLSLCIPFMKQTECVPQCSCLPLELWAWLVGVLTQARVWGGQKPTLSSSIALLLTYFDTDPGACHLVWPGWPVDLWVHSSLYPLKCVNLDLQLSMSKNVSTVLTSWTLNQARWSECTTYLSMLRRVPSAKPFLCKHISAVKGEIPMCLVILEMTSMFFFHQRQAIHRSPAFLSLACSSFALVKMRIHRVCLVTVAATWEAISKASALLILKSPWGSPPPRIHLFCCITVPSTLETVLAEFPQRSLQLSWKSSDFSMISLLDSESLWFPGSIMDGHVGAGQLGLLKPACHVARCFSPELSHRSQARVHFCIMTLW